MTPHGSMTARATIIQDGTDHEVWLQPTDEHVRPDKSSNSFIAGIYPTDDAARAAVQALQGITIELMARTLKA